MEKVAIPGLAFFFHDPVRVASAKAVPQLLSSFKAAHGLNSQEYMSLWKSTIDKVLEVLETEPAIEDTCRDVSMLLRICRSLRQR